MHLSIQQYQVNLFYVYRCIFVYLTFPFYTEAEWGGAEGTGKVSAWLRPDTATEVKGK